MSKLIDLKGEQFGALTVLDRAGNTTAGQATWRCRCSCGREKIIPGEHLRQGAIKSCGCHAQRNNEPKATYHPYYSTWRNMKARCNNPNNRAYADYGGRGIKVCPEWESDFWAFVRDMGEKPDASYSLDRIDCNAGYSPSNCRWASRTEQSRNKRVRKANSCGVKGVLKKGKSYRAVIGVQGRVIDLGTFSTLAEAVRARKQAEKQYWGQEMYENSCSRYSTE